MENLLKKRYAGQASFLNKYRGKRVLVTGHTGFKGSWLTLWLKHLGAKVFGVSLDPNTRPALFHEANIGVGIVDRRCDIRHMKTLQKIFSGFKPEIIFHLAAQPLVKVSYEKPVETFSVNVMGSVNLLEAVRQCASVKSLIYVTSDKCYERKRRSHVYSENDSLGGHDPYSASKAAAEIVFSSYLRCFYAPGSRIGAASIRAGNVIGGGDWARDRIVPDAVKNLATDRAIRVRNPDSIRPWQHVLEPLSGYLLLGIRLMANPLRFSGSWNFGPTGGEQYSVRNLVEQLISAWGKGRWLHHRDPKAVYEADTIRLSSNKASSRLSWRIQWDFEETVRRVVKWYHGYYAGQPAADLCVADILDYEKRLDRK